MKILTNRQYDQLIDQVAKANYDAGFEDGNTSGQEKGYKKGLHAGLIQDRTGVVMNGAGLYVFDDGIVQGVITEPMIK